MVHSSRFISVLIITFMSVLIITFMSVLIITFMSLTPSLVLAQEVPGLDPGFGTGGQVTTDFFGADDEAVAMALQPDGRIVVVGSTVASDGMKRFAIVRYLDGGTPDLSFGDRGKQNVDITPYSYPTDWSPRDQGGAGDDVASVVAIRPDGRIVVAGGTSVPSGDSVGNVDRFDAAVIQLTARDGMLDLSWSGDGKAIIEEGEYVHAMHLQSDGQLLIAGSPTVLRINRSARLDLTFGSGGSVDPPSWNDPVPAGIPDGFAFDLALTASGQIIVAGSYDVPMTSDGIPIRGRGEAVLEQSAIALARFSSTGVLDRRFGTRGTVVTMTHEPLRAFSGPVDWGRALAIHPDGGQLVVAGQTWAGEEEVVVVRYDHNGGRDLSFGEEGIARVDSGDGFGWVRDVLLQRDGKILIALSKPTADGHDQFAILRLTADGPIDRTFGDDGYLITDFGGTDSRAVAMVFQPDRKLLVAGRTNTARGETSDFAVARYILERTLTASGLTIDENIGTALIAVTSSGTSTLPISVDCAAGRGSATPGADYTMSAQTLTWSPGESGVKNCTVEIIDDTTVERLEDIVVDLTNARNTFLGNPSVNVQIMDNDAPGSGR